MIPLGPLAPYLVLIKAGILAALVAAGFGLGWHFGGNDARGDLADFKVEVAEGKAAQAQAAADKQVEEFKEAWERQAKIDEQARELANSLAEQARTNSELRSLLAEAKRRGTLTKIDPKNSCPVLDSGFVRLWNAAAEGRLPET